MHVKYCITSWPLRSHFSVAGVRAHVPVNYDYLHLFLSNGLLIICKTVVASQHQLNVFVACWYKVYFGTCSSVLAIEYHTSCVQTTS